MTSTVVDVQCAGNHCTDRNDSTSSALTLAQLPAQNSRGQAQARTEPVVTRCSIDGCFHVMRRLSFCNKHLQRFLRHGNPMVTLRPPPFEPKFRGRTP